MRVRAIPFNQQGERFWVGSVPAGELIECTEVDRWSPGHRDGYQREESERHARAFAAFLENGNPSPTVALLNVRRPDEPRVLGNGEIELPGTTFVVDYQHRRKGLEMIIAEKPDFAKFEVPVIITNWDKLREAEFFLILNKTAKTVRTDLAEEILLSVDKNRGKLRAMESLPAALVKSIEWRPEAVEIAHQLSDDKNGIWGGRIRLPNSPKTARTTVRQVSFTDSLYPILSNDNIVNKGKKGIIAMLDAYWRGIALFWPKCFEHAEDYVLLGTTGVMVMHKILPFIVGKLNGSSPDNPRAYAKLLDASGQTEKYWHKTEGEAGRFGTSQKAFGVIAAELRNSIDSES